jgi:NADPH:quinone reductase-like Zn-dependent oxidoreductase
MLAVQGLQAVGPLRAGRKLLINGAGGGVGTFAVQIARQHEVEVTGVDRADKLEMVRSLGATHVVDYASEDVTRTGRRYDAILDVKTSRSILDWMRVLNPGGVYATVGGSTVRLLEALLLWPGIAIRKKRFRVVVLKPNRDLAYVNQLFEAGKLVPVIDGPYELSEVPSAFRRFGEGSHQGKVVITVSRPA